MGITTLDYKLAIVLECDVVNIIAAPVNQHLKNI